MSWLCPYDHPCVRARPAIEISQLVALWLLRGGSTHEFENTLDYLVIYRLAKKHPENHLPKDHCSNLLLKSTVQDAYLFRNIQVLEMLVFYSRYKTLTVLK